MSTPNRNAFTKVPNCVLDAFRDAGTHSTVQRVYTDIARNQNFATLLRQRDLIEASGCSASTILRATRRLEDAGLITTRKGRDGKHHQIVDPAELDLERVVRRLRASKGRDPQSDADGSTSTGDGSGSVAGAEDHSVTTDGPEPVISDASSHARELLLAKKGGKKRTPTTWIPPRADSGVDEWEQVPLPRVGQLVEHVLDEVEVTPDTVRVRFRTKPTETVLKQLKGRKFIYNPENRSWVAAWTRRSMALVAAVCPRRIDELKQHALLVALGVLDSRFREALRERARLLASEHGSPGDALAQLEAFGSQLVDERAERERAALSRGSQGFPRGSGTEARERVVEAFAAWVRPLARDELLDALADASATIAHHPVVTGAPQLVVRCARPAGHLDIELAYHFVEWIKMDGFTRMGTDAVPRLADAVVFRPPRGETAVVDDGHAAPES